MTIAVGVIIWLLERRHSEHFGGVRQGLATGVWWSALTRTQATTDRAPGTLLRRLIAVGWMGASVIAIAVFTAGITSQLTAKQLQGAVHSVADLKSARVGAGSLDVLDIMFDEQNYAIVLPNGSPLRQRINLVMLSLTHSPWWDELNAKYLGRE